MMILRNRKVFYYFDFNRVIQGVTLVGRRITISVKIYEITGNVITEVESCQYFVLRVQCIVADNKLNIKRVSQYFINNKIIRLIVLFK